MFEKYIPELQKRFNVPDGCIVAGGAVANTLCNLIWGIDAPIRDVDTYHFETNVPNPPANLLQVVTGEYDSLSIAGMTLREVVEDEDLVQHIYLSTPERDISNSIKLRVVDSFDLNCVQVSFNGKQIYSTPAFEKFIQTRQLEVVWVHNTKTFFRLFKKRDDLGAYINKEKILEFFSQIQMANNSKIFNNFISDDYYQSIEKWIPEVEDMGVFIVNNRINFPLPKLRLGKLVSITQMINLINFVFSTKKGIRNKIQHIIKTWPNAGTLVRVAPEFFDHNFTNFQWEVLERVYGEHPTLYFHMTQKWGFETEGIDVSIAEHMEHCEKVYRLVQEYGNLIYGIVESMELSFEDIGEETYQEIERTARTKLKKASKTAVKPLPLPKIKGFEIRELTNGLMLMEEGDSMKHCVGGYSLEDNSRFFSISDKETAGRNRRTTLQLKFTTEVGATKFKVEQHYGFANSGITNEFKGVAEILVKHLNALQLNLPQGNVQEENFIPF